MPEIRYTDAFDRFFGKALKKYSDAKESTREKIDSIKPTDGSEIPGLGLGEDCEVRKARFELSEYNIGKSKGLRFIHLFIKSKDTIVPVTIYKKGTYRSETKVLRAIKESLKEVLEELREGSG